MEFSHLRPLVDGKPTYLDILNVDIFHTCLLRGTWRLSIYNSQQQCLMIRLNIDTLQLFWWATWRLHICSQTILASPFKRWNTIEKTVIYHDISQPFISDIHAFSIFLGTTFHAIWSHMIHHSIFSAWRKEEWFLEMEDSWPIWLVVDLPLVGNIPD